MRASIRSPVELSSGLSPFLWAEGGDVTRPRSDCPSQGRHPCSSPRRARSTPTPTPSPPPAHCPALVLLRRRPAGPRREAACRLRLSCGCGRPHGGAVPARRAASPSRGGGLHRASLRQRPVAGPDKAAPRKRRVVPQLFCLKVIQAQIHPKGPVATKKKYTVCYKKKLYKQMNKSSGILPLVQDKCTA